MENPDRAPIPPQITTVTLSPTVYDSARDAMLTTYDPGRNEVVNREEIAASSQDELVDAFGQTLERQNITHGDGRPLEDIELRAIVEHMQDVGLVSKSASEDGAYMVSPPTEPNNAGSGTSKQGYGAISGRSRTSKFGRAMTERRDEMFGRHSFSRTTGRSILKYGMKLQPDAGESVANEESTEDAEWQAQRTTHLRFGYDREELRAAHEEFIPRSQLMRMGGGRPRAVGTDRRFEAAHEDFFDDIILKDPQYAHLFEEDELRSLHEQIKALAYQKYQDTLHAYSQELATSGASMTNAMRGSIRTAAIKAATEEATLHFAATHGAPDAEDEVIAVINRQREKLFSGRGRKNDSRGPREEGNGGPDWRSDDIFTDDISHIDPAYHHNLTGDGIRDLHVKINTAVEEAMSREKTGGNIDSEELRRIAAEVRNEVIKAEAGTDDEDVLEAVNKRHQKIRQVRNAAARQRKGSR
jgi:hypothetical protein